MSSFSLQQKIDIVELWSQTKDIRKVRTEFAKRYGISKHPRLVPDVRRLKTVVNHFFKTGSVEPKHPGGRPTSARTENNIQEVRQLISEDQTVSIKQIVMI